MAITKTLLGKAFFIYSRLILYVEEYQKEVLGVPSLAEECVACLVSIPDIVYQEYLNKVNSTNPIVFVNYRAHQEKLLQWMHASS